MQLVTSLIPAKNKPTSPIDTFEYKCIFGAPRENLPFQPKPPPFNNQPSIRRAINKTKIRIAGSKFYVTIGKNHFGHTIVRDHLY